MWGPTPGRETNFAGEYDGWLADLRTRSSLWLLLSVGRVMLAHSYASMTGWTVLSGEELGKVAGRLGLFKAAARFLRRPMGHAVEDAGRDAARFTSKIKPNAIVSDLKDFRLPDVNSSALSQEKAKAIARLSDRQLLRSVFQPNDGWNIQAYRESRWVTNGNHRVAELIKRAMLAQEGGLTDSLITWDRPIYVEWLEG